MATDLNSLGTPFLLVDGERTHRNIDRLASYASRHGLGIRPHTKTHKSRRIAEYQLQSGAVGLTVAKAGEASVFASLSDDILVAYPIVDEPRAERLAGLAGETRIRVATDSQMSIDVLSEAARSRGTTIHLLIDIDVGYGRTGVQSVESATELAHAVERCGQLCLNGLFVYPGHVRGTEAEQLGQLRAISETLQCLVDVWTESGLCVETISGGSTPTSFTSHHVPQLTEIRPGTNVFNDLNTVYGGYCEITDCAASIVATVVSNAVPGQVVLDAGTKALTSDICGPAPDRGHGYLVEFPDAKIAHLTEEHAQVDIRRCAVAPELGQRVHVIPNHICVCVNLQDHFWWAESPTSDVVEQVPIDARGQLS